MGTLESAKFIDLLVAGKGHIDKRNRPTVVTGYVHISGVDLGLQEISLEDLIFNEQVWIEKFEMSDKMLYVSQCTFLDSLMIVRISGRTILFSECKAMHISVSGSKVNTARFHGLEVKGSLDISGIEASESLSLYNSKFEDLELLHNSAEHHIKVPVVKTDNILAITQFRLAGVPVLVSTKTAKGIIESGVEKFFPA